MDPILYWAAMEGKVDFLIQYNNNIDQFDVQVTPNNNTVLHVAAQFGHLQCVAQILGKCPMLLLKVNNKGETPLHIAAREGHSDILQVLIDCAKELDLESGGGEAARELLRARNHEDNDTALHMAVRNSHLEVVKLLLENEDPDYEHPANKAEETPLYLAADIRTVVVLFEILKSCISPAYSGPGGRTALHAAVISDYDIFSFRRSFRRTRILLEWKPDLIKEADKHGWTPLHYAVRCSNRGIAKLLLEKDKSLAYITTADEDGKKTALHIAAAIGAVRVMEEILSHCPDSWEMVNSEGQNILHIAVEMKQTKVIKFILEKSWSNHLMYQKDNIGRNTPLHLLSASSDTPEQVCAIIEDNRCCRIFNKNNVTPMENCEDKDQVITRKRKKLLDALISSDKDEDKDPVKKLLEGLFSSDKDEDKDQGKKLLEDLISVDEDWKNLFYDLISSDEVWKKSLQFLFPIDKDESGIFPSFIKGGGRNIVSNDQHNVTKWKKGHTENALEETRKAEAEDIKKRVESQLIVATLIATVTFAASFTLPGGYNGNQGAEQGMPVLIREAAFKAFVITNTVALVCSTSSVFLYATASFYSDNEKSKKHYFTSFCLILIAIGAMGVAFITGAYAVLVHSLGLAIVTCGIGCLSFVIYYLELRMMEFFSSIGEFVWRKMFLYFVKFLVNYESCWKTT